MWWCGRPVGRRRCGVRRTTGGPRAGHGSSGSRRHGRQHERGDDLNETWDAPGGAAHGRRDVLRQPTCHEPHGRRERQLQRDADPHHRAREEERNVARVDQALEMLLRDEGADPEGCKRHRRVAPRPRIRGEAEQRERRQDEDDLRRVREVVVHATGRCARDRVGDLVTDQHARSRERQRHEPGQRPAHPLMMPDTRGGSAEQLRRARAR